MLSIRKTGVKIDTSNIPADTRARQVYISARQKEYLKENIAYHYERVVKRTARLIDAISYAAFISLTGDLNSIQGIVVPTLAFSIAAYFFTQTKEDKHQIKNHIQSSLDAFVSENESQFVTEWRGFASAKSSIASIIEHRQSKPNGKIVYQFESLNIQLLERPLCGYMKDEAERTAYGVTAAGRMYNRIASFLLNKNSL